MFVVVDREDLRCAAMELGLRIDSLERSGFGDEALMEFKHVYLRLNWVLLKTANGSPEEFQATTDVLQNSPDHHRLLPDWLPCHKSPQRRQTPPCNPLSESCR